MMPAIMTLKLIVMHMIRQADGTLVAFWYPVTCLTGDVGRISPSVLEYDHLMFGSQNSGDLFK
jgi:hypothetical protein